MQSYAFRQDDQDEGCVAAERTVTRSSGTPMVPDAAVQAAALSHRHAVRNSPSPKPVSSPVFVAKSRVGNGEMAKLQQESTR